MRDIVLTGFMGTGKSTVGKILARRYGFRFVDTDAEIERRTGRKVHEIISQDGEVAFRRLERDALRWLQTGSGRVIATGGGALLSEENRDLLAADQPVICLTCEPTELLRRLDGAMDRPLLNPPTLQAIATLLEERSDAYAAFPQVDTSRTDPERIADQIAADFPLEDAAVIGFSRSSSSSICVAEGLLERLGELMREREIDGNVLLVTDTNVQSSGHASHVADSLAAAGYAMRCAVMPAGEQTKSLATLEGLYLECMHAGLDRGSTVIGLGGGVIGDLAGIVAATFMRGVRLMLAPTTLLAQVDAAIGGKVAVDVAGVKNLAGAFHPAELVAADPTVLSTLGPARIADGLAEIIKIGFIQSSELVLDLEGLQGPEEILHRTDIIRRAVQLKSELVARDPYEAGERMLLNFGHTVGHAVEAASMYRVSHGQAVAVGMAAELRLAVQAGWAPSELLTRLLELLGRMGLPDTVSGMKTDDVRRAMLGDKKRQRGTTHFVIPATLGKGEVLQASEAQSALAVQFAVREAP